MHDRRFVPFTLLLAAALLLLPVASYPQSFNGSVSGTVSDPSGSPVPGAAMTLKNTATGTEVNRVSEADGRYAFRNLLPGSYELRATVAGFQPYQSARRGADEQRRPHGRQAGPQQPDRTGRGHGGLGPHLHRGARGRHRARHAGTSCPCCSAVRPARRGHLRLLMPGSPAAGGDNPFDARINGGMALGRRGRRRRREHAAGLPEPERHDLDLPGLPLLPRHGERDQGRDLELRAAVRRQHLRPDHGHHQVRDATRSTARSSTTTRTTP